MDVRLAIVILAAGKSTRFHSKKSKLLHTICGQTVIEWVLDAVLPLEPHQVILVHGPHNEAELHDALGDDYSDGEITVPLTYALQHPALGTAHALLQAEPVLAEGTTDIIVLPGDAPLIDDETLRMLFEARDAAGAEHSVLTALMEDPTGYGRILHDGDPENGIIEAIVEEADATEEQRYINEVNSGMYLFSVRVFEQLRKAAESIGKSSVKGEYYLPDIVKMAPTASCMTEDYVSISGINDREQLAWAEQEVLTALRRSWMQAGVTFRMPETVYMHADVKLDEDVEIGPNCVLLNGAEVGRGTVIGPGCVLDNANIGENCTLMHVRALDCDVDDNVTIGPYVNLRPGTHLQDNVKVGNFVETKNAVIGTGSKLPHLQYVGDAELGENVNIGAGTIFCNYDGVNKHRISIGNNVFVGSNSSLQAPLTIGEGAYVAMGSAVTKDVPQDALAVGRARQENKEGYAARLREKAQRLKEQRAMEREREAGEAGGKS
ncbi:MAG: bifunctional UDP-N-acetylglucosamine diphosphorylase/glucosamine-1-phosphate N-acetyltransferase GlmU [bacterium]